MKELRRQGSVDCPFEDWMVFAVHQSAFAGQLDLEHAAVAAVVAVVAVVVVAAVASESAASSDDHLLSLG